MMGSRKRPVPPVPEKRSAAKTEPWTSDFLDPANRVVILSSLLNPSRSETQPVMVYTAKKRSMVTAIRSASRGRLTDRYIPEMKEELKDSYTMSRMIS